MFRNLKVLGLTLIAMLAMSAIAANAASADLLYAESTPATLTGSQEGTDELRVHAGAVKCSTIKYTGTTSAFGTSQISLTPSFSGCTFVGLVATVNMNGCSYLFHFNFESGNTTGSTDIVCPFEKEITITAPKLGTAKCIIHIPAQFGLGVWFSGINVGSGTTREVTLKLSYNALSYSQTAGTAETGNCATADKTFGGTYEGRALLTGENAAGTAHVGIFLG